MTYKHLFSFLKDSVISLLVRTLFENERILKI